MELKLNIKPSTISRYSISQSYLMELKHLSHNLPKSNSATLNLTLWNLNSISAETCGRLLRSQSYLMELKQFKTIFDMKRLLSLNRTLWNWNLFESETNKYSCCSLNRTLWNWNTKTFILFMPHLLLSIVPYGIETIFLSVWRSIRICSQSYLMELKQQSLRPKPQWLQSLNRTLWNWNTFIYPKTHIPKALSIVPYGIETHLNN